MSYRKLKYGAAVLLACLPPLHSSTAGASAEQVDQLIQTALTLDADLKRGAKVFGENCASCHGVNARGNAQRGIPALAAQRRAYLIKQLADFAESDRDGRQMHRVIAQAKLKEPQAWMDVAAYLNRLLPAPSPEKGSGARLSLGEAIFREQCASCHEPDARGDDDGFVPALRNQHYSYLLQQIRGLGDGHRRNVDEDLVRFIASMDEDEIASVADYLSRVKGPVRERLKMNSNGVVGD
jgi:cytochrome c553